METIYQGKKVGSEYIVEDFVIGGHIKVDDLSLKGKPMPYIILLKGALEELSEELFKNDFTQPKDVDIEIWENGSNTGRIESVGRYNHKELIPVGYTEYTSKNNVEYSYVFALPVPFEDYKSLVSADDYGKNKNVKLNLELYSESQLKDLYENDRSVEICDAITRLWLPENAEILDLLISILAGVDL